MMRCILVLVLAGSLMHQVVNACEANNDMALDDGAQIIVTQPINSNASDVVPRRRQLQEPTVKTYAVKPGDTVENIAGNFGVTKEALRAANPQLNTRKDKQRLKLLVGTKLSVPINDESTQGGSLLGPLNCKNDQVMVSCSTDQTCQDLDIPDFGCIDEPVCIQLYNLCLSQNPNCPSCCIKCRGKNPESPTNQTVGYYLMTFNDGSAHCDPWGWWR